MFEMPNDSDFEMPDASLKVRRPSSLEHLFLSGVTLDNAVIIIDEMQNLNFHELDRGSQEFYENTRIVS